jgi:DNA repair protein RecN (Recombination protein N)
MLKNLKIDNYALIDRLEISFGEGFNAITGETGAGKSILLGALGLALGNRADTQVLYDKDRKCIIEAAFLVKDYGLKEFFEDNELDFEDQALLRREIVPSGKSRAFINDTPVTLELLKQLGDRLVDIHSQHAVVTLNESDFQLAVVDGFAGSSALAEAHRVAYREYKRLEKELAALEEAEHRSASEKDYLQFIYEELESARIMPEEQEELENQIRLLQHAEEVRTAFVAASGLMSGGDRNVVGSLSEAESQLRKISAFYTLVQPLLERMQSSLIDLKDLDRELGRMADGIEYDPALATRAQERLDLIYHLEKKHHVNSCADLIRIKEEYGLKISEIESLDDRIAVSRELVARSRQEVMDKAGKLSSLRSSALPAFEQRIVTLLRMLGIPEAQFKVEQRLLEGITADGRDKIAFRFSANRGHEAKLLSEVASGGELSRVMLSIKSMISEKNLLPTVIFDEIDNGISGDIAGKVGDILVRTAAAMQVIAITHLPQIAGKSASHYIVYKQAGPLATFSHIRKLDHEERVSELAKMIAGQEVTPAARAAARELLDYGAATINKN